MYCLADVDDKKINGGYYVNRQLDLRIPIIHFSLLARDPAVRKQLMASWEEGITGSENSDGFGRIDKSKPGSTNGGKAEGELLQGPPVKRRKLYAVRSPRELDMDLLPTLPVVVCVAMYRTGGALEHNVSRIGRTEGKDLWHFS